MRFFGILSILALLVAPAAAAPLEAYGALPQLDQVEISPDGKNIAYHVSNTNHSVVVVRDIASHKTVAQLNIGDQKLRDISWAGPKFIVVTTSKTAKARMVIAARQEFFLAQSLDITNGDQKALLENIDDAMNVLTKLPQTRVVGGQAVVFLSGVFFPMAVEHERREGVPALFMVNLDSDYTRKIDFTSGDERDWTLDDQGKILATSDYNEASGTWTLRVKLASGWSEVFSAKAPIDRPHLRGLSTDGKSLVLHLMTPGGPEARLVGLDDGKVGPPVPAMLELDTLIQDPITHRIIGGRRVDEKAEYIFFDPNDQAAWNGIARAFQDEDLRLVSWSNDRRKIVVEVAGTTDGDIYRLVDLDAGRADPVGDVYADIGSQDIAPVKAITYAAGDGLKIFAYLTLPIGKAASALPLVVLPHGGPASRDQPGFDWWSQALASRGYAVLQPQFRGSDGFDWSLLTAGYGQWGRKMQSDLSDGVAHLARQGIIDAKRVCIVGASYGGYAALAGAALDTGVYRCAVSVGGLSDLRRFLSWTKEFENTSDSFVLRYWVRFMGATSTSDPALDAISPITHVDHVAIPVLLIHGRDDTVVPLEQSQLMADALKRAGKQADLVILPGEDHWLSRSETRLQMLSETVKFLEANNPPN